jgi:histidine triad (HIT) family protein
MADIEAARREDEADGVLATAPESITSSQAARVGRLLLAGPHRGEPVTETPAMPGKSPDCPFCDRVANGEFDYEDKFSVAFQPRNPVTPGHFLVVSRKHVPSALEGPLDASSATGLAAELARDMGLTACNIITSAGAAATQTVMHLHVHVVPRRDGDGLALPWTGQRKDGAARS